MRLSTVIAAFILLVAPLANTKNMTSDEFAHLAADVSLKVSNHKYETKEIDLSKIKPSKGQKLSEIMDQEQAIWFDTILEGDYALGNDDLRIDSLAKVLDDKKHVVALRLTFSQDAFLTASCDFDMEQLGKSSEEDVKLMVDAGCTRGRIVGNAIVSVDLQFHERDSEEIENFVEN